MLLILRNGAWAVINVIMLSLIGMLQLFLIYPDWIDKGKRKLRFHFKPVAEVVGRVLVF